MGRLLKGLQAMLTLVANPSLLYHITHRPEVYSGKVKDHFPHFSNGLPQVKIEELVNQDSIFLPVYSFKPGTSDIPDLMLLAGIAAQIKSCQYLELGTFRGESLLSVSQYADRCTSVSLDKSTLAALGYPEDEIESQDYFLSDLPKKVSLVKSDSRTFDFSRLVEQPNLIFVDADHHYEAVKADTINIFNQVDPESTIVVWHDYLTPQRTIDYQVLLGILEGVKPEFHDRLMSVDTTRCVVYWPHLLQPTNKIHRFQPSNTYNITISKN